MSKLIKFWKIKSKETLAMCTHESAYARSFLHAYASSILHTHSDFQKATQGKFSAFMLRFGMNLTSSEDHSKPILSHYKKPYMIYFQNIQKSCGKILRFTKNINQRGSFSLNILKSIFFWLEPFLALIFEFKNTNNYFIELWIDLTEGNNKKSRLKSFSLRY